MKNDQNLPLLDVSVPGYSSQEDLIKNLIHTPNFQAHICHSHMYNNKNRTDYKWWQWAIFIQQSWQLTALGLTYFSSNYKTFKIYNEANNMISGRLILGFNQVIKGPWLVRRNCIYTWNADIYCELMMFDGNVHTYLSFKE